MKKLKKEEDFSTNQQSEEQPANALQTSREGDGSNESLPGLPRLLLPSPNGLQSQHDISNQPLGEFPTKLERFTHKVTGEFSEEWNELTSENLKN